MSYLNSLQISVIFTCSYKYVLISDVLTDQSSSDSTLNIGRIIGFCFLGVFVLCLLFCTVATCCTKSRKTVPYSSPPQTTPPLKHTMPPRIIIKPKGCKPGYKNGEKT